MFRRNLIFPSYTEATTRCHARKYSEMLVGTVVRPALAAIQLPCKPLKRSAGDVDWVDLAQDMDMWRELVNAVLNRRVP
jgi:hypothetical protein